MLRAAADAVTGSAAPWWGTGAFTLAGGLVIAVLGQVFARRNERRKAEIERVTAEQALCRDALFDFLAAAYGHQSAGTSETAAALFATEARFSLLMPEPLKGLGADYLRATYDLVAAQKVKGRGLTSGSGSEPEIRANRLHVEAYFALLGAAEQAPEIFGLPKSVRR